MYNELSKKEKKIARECIDKGLEAVFKKGLEKVKWLSTIGGRENSVLIKKHIINYIKRLLITMMQFQGGTMD